MEIKLTDVVAKDLNDIRILAEYALAIVVVSVTTYMLYQRLFRIQR